MLLAILLSLFSFNSYSSVIEPKVIWPSSEVQVCFADKIFINKLSQTHRNDYWFLDYGYASWSVEQKKIIKDTITNEFTAKKTGVHFEGWLDCNQTQLINAIIVNGVTNFDANGRSSLGLNGHLVQIDRDVLHFVKGGLTPIPSVWINTKRKAKKINTNDQLKLTALHEFGHLAGLQHEEEREDAPYNNECKMVGFSPKGLKYQSTVYNGDYEFDSIMNSCHLFYTFNVSGKVQAQLTILDQDGLKKLYPQL